MKKILIASYDMEVGGVERSLASMLNQFDYRHYDVDVMLYRHQGDFMSLLPEAAHLLPELPEYATFRQSIAEMIRKGHYRIAFGRIKAKLHAGIKGRFKRMREPGYYQMQLIWKYVLPFLPARETEYDAAISYLWPHDYVANKVRARTKVAWIHTDYSTIETDVEMDLHMWSKFDHIIAVSEACRESFLKKYRFLEEKVHVMENLTSPEFIQAMSREEADPRMAEDQRFKLVTVGRLTYAKGLDHAVQAMKLLLDKGLNNLSWYVVGYGGEEAKLRELIAEHNLEDHFILLGKQMNPYPYIRECDLYVQPSRYEGKAVTVTEAQILGKPVLITDYSTARSQITDGVDGCITELSIEGIAAGIERLYEDSALRRRIAQYCSQTNYSNGYELEKLYSCLAEAKEGSTSAM